LTKWTKQYPDAKTSVIEQPTIAVNRRGGLPIQYYSGTNFKKKKKFQFLWMKFQNETFAISDVNLKFNKPEVNVTIDGKKSESLGISVIDIAQTFCH
jgi:HAE1 family hydrophobic/amphiphilic exporter-1/multidrug efflux pump